MIFSVKKVFNPAKDLKVLCDIIRGCHTENSIGLIAYGIIIRVSAFTYIVHPEIKIGAG